GRGTPPAPNETNAISPMSPVGAAIFPASTRRIGREVRRSAGHNACSSERRRFVRLHLRSRRVVVMRSRARGETIMRKLTAGMAGLAVVGLRAGPGASAAPGQGSQGCQVQILTPGKTPEAA